MRGRSSVTAPGLNGAHRTSCDRSTLGQNSRASALRDSDGQLQVDELSGPSACRIEPCPHRRLQRRSAYLMTGASRNAYEHHIPAVTTLRYSITFRTLRV